MPTTTPTQPKYRLADHVRACNVDGQVILLDLQQDKYIGAGGTSLSSLSALIADWPATGLDASASHPDDGITPWINKLRQQGLLVLASAAPPQTVALGTAQESLSYADPMPSAGWPWRRLATLAWSAAITTAWLKRYSLATIADKVAQLRAGRPATISSDLSSDIRRAAAWYLRMRPLVITSHDKCLHDSLTLVRFLASEHLYPQWVVGVRTRPFAAHSWVQSGPLVLNDVHEYVRGFTPILIV